MSKRNFYAIMLEGAGVDRDQAESLASELAGISAERQAVTARQRTSDAVVPDSDMRHIQIQLPATAYDQGKGLAHGNGLSMAAYVRQAILERIRHDAEVRGVVKEERPVKGIRLDLSPTDHQRLERIARERGLTMASYARMVLLERLKADDGPR